MRNFVRHCLKSTSPMWGALHQMQKQSFEQVIFDIFPPNFAWLAIVLLPLVWGLLTQVSGQPGTFDPKFGFFWFKALKGSCIFWVKALKNQPISVQVGFKMGLKVRVFSGQGLKKYGVEDLQKSINVWVQINILGGKNSN